MCIIYFFKSTNDSRSNFLVMRVLQRFFVVPPPSVLKIRQTCNFIQINQTRYYLRLHVERTQDVKIKHRRDAFPMSWGSIQIMEKRLQRARVIPQKSIGKHFTSYSDQFVVLQGVVRL